MGQTRNSWGFPDCRAFMDKAVDSTKGWQVTFKTKGQAMNFRMRCYTARDRELKQNVQIYDLGHPLHTATVWHKLTFDVKEVGGEVLCDQCREKVTTEKPWQVVASHGENSLKEKALNNGPL